MRQVQRQQSIRLLPFFRLRRPVIDPPRGRRKKRSENACGEDRLRSIAIGWDCFGGASPRSRRPAKFGGTEPC